MKMNIKVTYRKKLNFIGYIDIKDYIEISNTTINSMDPLEI